MSFYQESQYLLEQAPEDLLVFYQAQPLKCEKFFMLPASCIDAGQLLYLQASVSCDYIFTAAGGLSSSLMITVTVPPPEQKAVTNFRSTQVRRRRFSKPHLLTAVRRMTVLRQ